MLTGRRINLVLILTIAFVGLAAQVANGQAYDVGVPPGNNFDQAQFRLWVPDGVKSVRAVLVLVPGSNGDGRDQVEIPLWRELAEKENLALVGLYMTDKPHDDMFIEHYVDVANGSGEAFLNALGQLGRMSGHPEIDTAPLLLWGMSAGGEFNYEFALWRPERVAGFVVNKGGIYYSALASREARNVPGLFFIGDEDLAFRNDIIRGVFSINRRAGALWALVEQPGVAHAVAGSDEFAALYYRQVLNLRLGDRLNSSALRTLSLSDGFLCDPESQACEGAAGAATPREPVSWLPTEVLAEAWRQAGSAVLSK